LRSKPENYKEKTLQPMPPGDLSRLGAVFGLELAQDVGDMVFHGALVRIQNRFMRSTSKFILSGPFQNSD
jgi:hypothetical protein